MERGRSWVEGLISFFPRSNLNGLYIEHLAGAVSGIRAAKGSVPGPSIFSDHGDEFALEGYHMPHSEFS